MVEKIKLAITDWENNGDGKPLAEYLNEQLTLLRDEALTHGIKAFKSEIDQINGKQKKDEYGFFLY